MKKFKIYFDNLDIFCEDMYYAEYGNIQIDIGFYGGIFVIYILKDGNFDNPLDKITFYDDNLIEYLLKGWENKVISGYYDKEKVDSKHEDGDIRRNC